MSNDANHSSAGQIVRTTNAGQIIWINVIRRDRGKCVICGEKACDVHEIISRSHFGTRTMHICLSMKNRVCLCRGCHEKAQGQAEWMTKLLQRLKDKYGYDYPEPIFQRYLGGSDGRL